MEDLDNNTSTELDASPLPPLSDRIRFFQQGGKSLSPANSNILVEDGEEEYVEPPIDYSSPPPVSVRKLLFNNSDAKGHETSSPSSSFRTKIPYQSSQKSNSSSNENSVAAKAKLLNEKVRKEEKKAKQKNIMNNADEEDGVEKDVPPELLSLADRVKKFSSASPPKKSSKKYGSAAVATTQSQSYRKLNHSVPPLVPSSPVSSASSYSSHVSSPYHENSVASNCLYNVNESFASIEEREEDEIPPAPPSHNDDNDEFTIIKNNNSTLPYYRNWKSGGSSSNRKVWKFPTNSNNDSFNPENCHYRKYSTSSVDWDISDQFSMASSVSEITY